MRVSSGAAAAEAAKYDGDHRCWRWVRSWSRWRSRRAETPLRECTSPGDGDLRRGGDQQVDVVVLAVQLQQVGAEVGAHPGEHPLEGVQVVAGQHPSPVGGHEDQLHVAGGDDVAAWPVVVIVSHRPTIRSGMLVRYRYRIDPAGRQRP